MKKWQDQRFNLNSAHFPTLCYLFIFSQSAALCTNIHHKCSDTGQLTDFLLQCLPLTACAVYTRVIHAEGPGGPHVELLSKTAEYVVSRYFEYKTMCQKHMYCASHANICSNFQREQLISIETNNTATKNITRVQ